MLWLRINGKYGVSSSDQLIMEREKFTEDLEMSKGQSLQKGNPFLRCVSLCFSLAFCEL